MEKVRQVILPSSTRPGSTKVMFIVTSGKSNVGGSPKKVADYLKNRANVETYVIGVGKRVLDGSLRSLASANENIFHVKSYKRLYKSITKIFVTMTVRGKQNASMFRETKNIPRKMKSNV